MHNERIYQMAIEGKAHEIMRFVEGRQFSNMDMLRRLACEGDYDFGPVCKELLRSLESRPDHARLFDDMTPFSAARVIARIVIKVIAQMDALCMEGFQDECNTTPSLLARSLLLDGRALPPVVEAHLYDGLKILAIKALRQAYPSLGLRDAKDIIDRRQEALASVCTFIS